MCTARAPDALLLASGSTVAHNQLCFKHETFALSEVQTQRRLFAEWLARRAWVPRPLGRLAARWTLLLRQWRDAASTETAFQVVPH
jgi:hypothetical protein